jgi:hypothetical protein
VAVFAKEAIDLVTTRARTGPPATSRTFLRSLLDQCQRVVQAAVPGWVIQVQLTSFPRQLIYPVVQFAEGSPVPAEDHPPCLRVMRVAEGFPPRDLQEVSWKSFGQADRRWMRARRGRYEQFARLGVDYLLLYPGKDEPSAVTIYYAPIPTPLGDEDTKFELRDDRLPAVYALAEAIQLLRARTPTGFVAAWTAFMMALARLELVRGTGIVGYGEGGFGGRAGTAP